MSFWHSDKEAFWVGNHTVGWTYAFLPYRAIRTGNPCEVLATRCLIGE
jgi:hypothetical protein